MALICWECQEKGAIQPQAGEHNIPTLSGPSRRNGEVSDTAGRKKGADRQSMQTACRDGEMTVLRQPSAGGF